MTKDTQNPGSSEAGRGVAAQRKARLAAALRENLRKRKAQARERAAAELGPDSVDLPADKSS
jgi:hypothetical protein